MHCPKCGQQQISDEIRYCSRCGFLLTGIAEVVSNDGLIPGGSVAGRNASSPRKRGIKQGAFIFLLTFLIVPLIAIIAIAVGEKPIAAAMTAVFLIFGGLLRIVYALMFESVEAGVPTIEDKLIVASKSLLSKRAKNRELPPGISIPASAYIAPETENWRDSNDLVHSASVTDSTTKLLQKERENQ